MTMAKIKKRRGDTEATPAETKKRKTKKKAVRGLVESAGSRSAITKEPVVSEKKRPKKKRRSSLPLEETSEPTKKRKKPKGQPEEQKGAGHITDVVKRRKRRAKSSDALTGPAEATDAAGKAKQQKAAEKDSSGKGVKKQRKEASAESKGDEPESDQDSFFAGEGKGKGGGSEDEGEGSGATWREPDKVIDDFKVWVGDLPWECSEEGVQADFARFGEIQRFDMPRNRKGLPDGVAFIYYATEKAMKKALALDGQNYHGKNIKVKHAKPQNREKKQEDEGKTNDALTVFVGNLPFEIEEDDLRKSFGECGEVEAIRMLRGPNGNFKGIAFVVFKTLKAVRKALLRDSEEYQGRNIKVSKPQERKAEAKGEGKGRGKGEGKADGKGQGKGKGKGRDLTPMTVFVGSLPPDTKMEKVKEDFTECGPVDCVRMVKDQDGHFKGAAFIVFKNAAGAKKALEWNGEFFYGSRPIKVAPARKGEQRSKDDAED